jgi:hypothetical protein
MSSKAVQTPRLIGEQSCDLAGGFDWIYLTPHDVITPQQYHDIASKDLVTFPFGFLKICSRGSCQS